MASELKRSSSSSAAHAHRADLARPRGAGPQAGRLEVEDDERRPLEQQLLARRGGERDEVAGPAQPRVRRDRLGEQRAREPDGHGRAELQHLPRRLVGGHRPAALLDELDEPVGGIETELHRPMLERTYVRVQSGRAYSGA